MGGRKQGVARAVRAQAPNPTARLLRSPSVRAIQRNRGTLMTKYLATYAATLFAFLAIDFVWLGFVATKFYKDQLGSMMLEKPNLGVAFVFYALYAAGMVLFAVMPGLEDRNWLKTAALGAALGLVAYGTYDLTNYATLKNWPLAMSLVDLAWGAVVTAAGATVGYFVSHWLFD